MPKLLQINTVINSGSTGRIAEDIGKLAMQNGWESYIAFGRNQRPSASHVIQIGRKFDVLWHVLVTRLFDLHGLASRRATKKFVRQIEKIRPDVIHLHNIHGYYLNYKILFRYLAKSGTPVVWTMHDCWPATGHCPHYTFAKCLMWTNEKGCRRCPQKRRYPASLLFSNAAYNFRCKKTYFNLLAEEQLTIVTPSQWLSNEIANSYLGHYRRIVINNGIDLEVFKPTGAEKERHGRFTILGVASVWDERKGLNDCIKLSALLCDDEEIVLVGLSERQIASLPAGRNIHGLRRTENQTQLAELYSRALCFVNPTYEDTFPTTNIESLACGTPVITYRTGGSPEILDENTGFVTEAGEVGAVYECIQKIRRTGKSMFTSKCRERAERYFAEEKNFEKYLDLYNVLMR